MADALKLQDQMKLPVKTLSEGIKRKVGTGPGVTLHTLPVGVRHTVLSFQLCFALSILGNPSVVLLDEPSTGMDPEGQQQMW